MSQAKFTPRPWVVLPEEFDKPYIRVRGTALGRRYKIANVPTPVHNGVLDGEAEETRANANLISAAPDMYVELEAAMNVFRFYQGHHAAKGHSEKEQTNKQYADRIAKVLAKAIGDA